MRELAQPGARRYAHFALLAFITLAAASYAFLRGVSPAGVELSGTVVSAGVISVAPVNGGAQSNASVRIASGEVVHARVLSGIALSEGDAVVLRKYARVMPGYIYQVVQHPP